jgi:isopentenyldiphosphate isomerase
MTATTDPDELLEVYDAAGRPTGIAKRRADIHRDGDWHLAFFCWIVRRTRGASSSSDGRGELEIVLQRRAATKDVWPGRFDASAAGHVRFGESVTDATREIEEELGLQVEARELRHVLRHRQEHVHQSGLVDREIHDVHLVRVDRALDEYRPGPEVTGLVAVPLDELLELVDGRRGAIATTLVTFDAGGSGAHADGHTHAHAHAHHEPKLLHRDELVPYDAGYHAAIAAAARSL